MGRYLIFVIWMNRARTEFTNADARSSPHCAVTGFHTNSDNFVSSKLGVNMLHPDSCELYLYSG